MTFVFDSSFWEDFRAMLSCMVRQPRSVVGSLLVPALGLWVVWVLGIVHGPFWPTVSIVLSVVNLLLAAIDRVDRMRRNKATSGRTVISMDDNGITASTAMLSISGKWADLVKIRETKSFFFFYLRGRGAQMLPTRVVGSAADVQALREFIAAHHKPAAC